MTADEAVTTSGLRVLVADEDRDALDRLATMLEQLGHGACAFAIEISKVSDEVVAEDPDVSIVVLHNDDGHALALIDEIAAYASGPVIALTQRDNAEFVARAAELGIAAYGRPETPDAVQSAIELALHRHAEVEELTERVDQLEGALERRAIIERAKGILMERHELDAPAAFELLRAHARGSQQRVVDVARGVADEGLELP
jgi:AmiR/NasT family two-component response regulator